MNEAYQTPMEPRPFNVVDAMIGVFVRPVQAMRSVAAARPWPIAILILIVLILLSGVIALTAPLQQVPPTANVSPEMASMMAVLTSRGFVLALVLLSPIFNLAYIGILYLIARMLGGKGFFSAMFSTSIFASLPGVLSLPLSLAANLLGIPLLSLIIQVVIFAISIWTIVLQVIGIRESMNFTTTRAVVTWLIPFGILLFFGCILACLLVGFLTYTVQQALPDLMLPVLTPETGY